MNAGRARGVLRAWRHAAAGATLVLGLPIGSMTRAEPGTAPATTTRIERIGAIRFVAPGDEAAAGTVLTADRLRSRLEEERGRPCEPFRIEEEIASRYRALGYVPTVRAWCADGELSIAVRESSHRIAIVTFDVPELAPLGVQPQRLQDEKPLYPVPESAPRAVVRGLLQTRPGDLYNVERYRLDRIALARFGYALLFIPGAAPSDEEIGTGAYLIQSTAPMEEEASKRSRRGPLNYLGGTAGYGPRTGGSAGVVYQRRDVITGLDTLSLTPTFSTAWGGEIGYSAPLVAAHKEPKRIYDLGGSLFTTSSTTASSKARSATSGAPAVRSAWGRGRSGCGRRTICICKAS